MSKLYYEKLKDPRWQKKRLEIMGRSNFKCENCGDSKTELHVHHIKYEYGKNPWEYDEDDLIALCSECHKVLHDIKETLIFAIWEYFSISRFMGDNEIPARFFDKNIDMESLSYAFMDAIRNPDYVLELIEAHRCQTE